MSTVRAVNFVKSLEYMHKRCVNLELSPKFYQRSFTQVIVNKSQPMVFIVTFGPLTFGPCIYRPFVVLYTRR